MTPFEYVSVLISIVLGLGITQIVTGVADIIHQWDRVKIYWPHVMWIIFVFFLHIEEWWVLYDLRSYETWRLPVFLFTVLYPINLFILARILFPFGMSEPRVDLKEFYYNNYRKFFLLISILSVLSIIDNFIQNRPVTDQVVPLIMLAVTTIVSIKRYENELLHKAIVVLLVVGMIASFAIQWNEWLIAM